jgi:hypothetical protein
MDTSCCAAADAHKNDFSDFMRGTSRPTLTLLFDDPRWTEASDP